MSRSTLHDEKDGDVVSTIQHVTMYCFMCYYTRDMPNSDRSRACKKRTSMNQRSTMIDVYDTRLTRTHQMTTTRSRGSAVLRS